MDLDKRVPFFPDDLPFDMPDDHPDKDISDGKLSPYKLVYLVKRYGYPYVKEAILKYIGLLTNIGDLNNKLAEINSDKQQQEYMTVVQDIIDATQEYYTYIGSLKEDMRKYLLLVAQAMEYDEESISQISDIVGKEILLESPPFMSVQAIRPKNYIMHMDAITNHLAELSNETQLDLTVGKSRNTPIRTTVALDMPDHMRIEGGGTLSTYDKSIINGVTSLLENGNTVFSIPMLYHAMTGKKNPSIDENLSEEIAGKLDKMRRIIISIDLTEENEAHYLKDKNGNPIVLEDVSLEGYLLPLNKVTGVVNGKRTEVFQIIQHPPIYTYSKLKRQLSSIPIFLLDAPINNNATTIPLKTYLLQRLELMKNKNNKIKSNTILYESVYKEVETGEINKTKKMRIRKYTTKILDYLIENEYIISYKEFKKGRAIAGVDVELKPNCD